MAEQTSAIISWELHAQVAKRAANTGLGGPQKSAAAQPQPVSRTRTMNTAWIQFKKWQYEPGVFHVEVSASDAGYAASQDFYIAAGEIVSLAKRLQAFPRDLTDEITLTIGERDTKWAHAVNLRFWICDASGHGAITFDVSNNGAEPYARNALFTVRCEVASLNRLGKDLAEWVQSDEESVLTELTT